MTEPTPLERFLNTDPADVGCAEAIEVLLAAALTQRPVA